MTRVLVVKLSSMGDILHTLPALTDAARMLPNLQVDWVVEEGFKEIPVWHSAVDRIIPVALRRWRRERLPLREVGRFIRQLRAKRYDAIIDAQGLFKSAVIARLARGPVHGLARSICREPNASRLYTHAYDVGHGLHAIDRTRLLFATLFGYLLPKGVAEYGFTRKQFVGESSEPYLVFIHGTTWPTKHWPDEFWLRLAELAGEAGWRIKVPSGIGEAEKARAVKIANAHPNCELLPPNRISDMAAIITNASATVAVDTGFAHMAAAFNVPTVALYGPTDPAKIGTQGRDQTHLVADFPCAPCGQEVCTFKGEASHTPACFGTMTPDLVWNRLKSIAAHSPLPLGEGPGERADTVST